jgi:hypothetical protein
MEYGAVMAVPTSVLFAKKSTFVTPWPNAAVAVAARVTGDPIESAAPADGEVSAVAPPEPVTVTDAGVDVTTAVLESTTLAVRA